MGLFSNIYSSLKEKEKKELFSNLCQSNKLTLEYSINNDSVSILKEIFFERVYSDYFPFYSNSVIVDIGAHKGYFSLFACNNLKPESRIIAYEPVIENYNIMLKNLVTNKIQNINSHNKGIYSKYVSMDIYTSKSENNSIFSDYNGYLEQENHQKVKADFITLEDIFEENNLEIIDFLKLDVEGAEYDILFNSDKKTLKKIKVMSIEFHDLKKEEYTGVKLVQHLKNNGFEIVKFNHESSIINNNFGKIIALNNN